jgi:hypothetical protein
MNLNKMMKSSSNGVFGIILLFGVVVLAVILSKYSETKSNTHEKLTMQASPFDVSYAQPSQMNAPQQYADPSFSMPTNNYLEVSGIQSPSPPSNCNGQNNLNPSDLLPKDSNSQWSALNPNTMNGGDILMPDLLQAGYHIGLDTIGQTLRNPNYQLRSDPVIQKADIGPWNQSTIEPDYGRVPLEIGQGAK